MVMPTKKNAQHENCELFYLGQSQDYSPGDIISDSSEKLLQRGRREGQYICDFGEEGVHAIKHIFFLQKVSASLVKVTASHEERVKDFVCLKHEGF